MAIKIFLISSQIDKQQFDYLFESKLKHKMEQC